LVTQLHEWLRPNLEKSVKLGDAAARFHKSPRQLIRILKETTGAGFAEHLTMHRLTLARALLMRSGQSVMEVARASGFNSREQFIRSFNKAFGWTPLQFRKAWNQAALTDAELAELCQVSERSPVEWLPANSVAASPDEEGEGTPHTVVVANALHDIVELFWVTPQGKRARIDVLERGGMVFVNRDNGGSCWIVRVPSSGRERCFRTPDDHALAVVTSATLDG
jgi:AraC-like DNA-binding protein